MFPFFRPFEAGSSVTIKINWMTAARLDHFRAYARFPLRVELSVSPLGATYDQQATLVDLGLGGTCFEIAETFEVGQRLRMEFDLPRLWDRLTLHGEVASSRSGLVGRTDLAVESERAAVGAARSRNFWGERSGRWTRAGPGGGTHKRRVSGRGVSRLV